MYIDVHAFVYVHCYCFCGNMGFCIYFLYMLCINFAYTLYKFFTQPCIMRYFHANNFNDCVIFLKIIEILSFDSTLLSMFDI